MNRHPSLEQLALYAGGDLPALRQFLTRLHVRKCEVCAACVVGFQEAGQVLKDTALAMPESLDWQNLAAEMKANIRLGLTAGAIAGDGPVVRKPVADAAGWRVGVVFASLSFVLVAGWWLRNSQPGAVHQGPSALVLNVGSDGLALHERDRALTLLNPSEQPVVTTVNWDGGARARYVDSETGQVTIHHVATE